MSLTIRLSNIIITATTTTKLRVFAAPQVIWNYHSLYMKKSLQQQLKTNKCSYVPQFQIALNEHDATKKQN